MSVLAGSSRFGFFRAPAESNGFAVTRERFDALGGFDERFTSAGGGLCNLEMFTRHATASGTQAVCLLSEGTFHQVHGGIATSGRKQWGDFDDEHQQIFGVPYEQPSFRPWLYGPLRPEVRPFLEMSVAAARADEGPVIQPAAEPEPEPPEPPRPAPARSRWASRLARLRPRQ
jgi:hypothetical protein